MTAEPSPQFTTSLNAALAFWKLQETKGDISHLDRERQNLNRVIEMGLALPETQLRAIEAALGAFDLVYMKGYWWEWLPVLELAIEQCPDEERELKFELLNRYGELFRYSGHPGAALTVHQELLALALELETPLKLGEAHTRLGLTYRKLGQFETAEHHYQLALKELNRSGEAGHSLIGTVLSSQGKIADKRGDYQAAKDFFRQAVAIWQQLSDTLRLAMALNDLGYVFQHNGEFEEAGSCFQEAMGLLVGTEHNLDYIMVQTSLGTLLFSQQRWSEAESAFRAIDLDYLRQTNNLLYEARVVTSLGNTMLYQNEAGEAVTLLQRAVMLWNQMDDKEELANAVGSLGEALALKGERETAEKQFVAALDILAELPDYPRVLRLRSFFTVERQKLDSAPS